MPVSYTHLLDGPQCLVVRLDHPLHILRRTGTSLYLQHTHAGLYAPVEERYRAQVFRRAQVTSFHGEDVYKRQPTYTFRTVADDP